MGLLICKKDWEYAVLSLDFGTVGVLDGTAMISQFMTPVSFKTLAN
jgi:hypothetical protein